MEHRVFVNAVLTLQSRTHDVPSAPSTLPGVLHVHTSVAPVLSQVSSQPPLLTLHSRTHDVPSIPSTLPGELHVHTWVAPVLSQLSSQPPLLTPQSIIFSVVSAHSHVLQPPSFFLIPLGHGESHANGGHTHDVPSAPSTLPGVLHVHTWV